MSTFLQLCKDTRMECGVQGAGPTTVVAQAGILERVVYWVKEADLYIQRMHTDWGFLWEEFTDDTVADSADLTEPGDVNIWDIESFARDRGTTDGAPLSIVDFRTWRGNNYAKTSQQPNRLCILPDNTLKLEFPADGVYEIYANYWKQPVEMTADASTPLYSSEFHRAIVAKAKMFFFEDREVWNSYQSTEKEFLEVLIKMRNRYLPQAQQLSLNSPQQMVIRPV